MRHSLSQSSGLRLRISRHSFQNYLRFRGAPFRLTRVDSATLFRTWDSVGVMTADKVYMLHEGLCGLRTREPSASIVMVKDFLSNWSNFVNSQSGGARIFHKTSKATMVNQWFEKIGTDGHYVSKIQRRNTEVNSRQALPATDPHNTTAELAEAPLNTHPCRVLGVTIG